MHVYTQCRVHVYPHLGINGHQVDRFLNALPIPSVYLEGDWPTLLFITERGRQRLLLLLQRGNQRFDSPIGVRGDISRVLRAALQQASMHSCV